MRKFLEHKEVRLALAICGGLLAYQVITAMTRLAFHDHRGWHYDWMAAFLALLTAGAFAAKKHSNLRAWTLRFRTEMIVAAFVFFVCGFVLVFVADLRHASPLDFSTFRPIR